MLIQRTCCQSWFWQKQISSPSSSRHLLHHAQSHPTIAKPFTRHHILFRAFRTSARQNKSSRANELRIKPFQDLINGGGSVPPGNVVKALIFTGTFSVGCFIGATVLEYENARNMMLSKVKQTKFSWLERKQIVEVPNSWQQLKDEIRQYWDRLTPGDRVFAPICAINLLVFAMWRVPALRNTMTTYFCTNPATRAVCWPMSLSTFSHYSILHIFANMYVLHSFSNAAVLAFGKEQFLGFYLSAGVVSSLASVMYKAITSQAGPSVGASGAIMAILAYVCSQYPDTQLSLLFVPMLTFSAATALKCLIGFDLAGCMLGWKLFDHAAHLGGAFYGIFWAYFGTQLWQKRITFLSMYHDWRKTK